MTSLVGTFVPGDDAGLRIALHAASLPIEDLAEPGRLFLRCDAKGGRAGDRGLEPLGSGALLRSLAVVPEGRGRGRGRTITGQIPGLAAGSGAERVRLFTTGATAVFEGLGFVRANRHDAPASVLATSQACPICGTAPLLARTLGRADAA